MAQQWIVKLPQAASAPLPPTPQTLPNAILGTVKLVYTYGTDQNNQWMVEVTIPVSFASGPGDVDRFVVHLQAPDGSADTQEAFVGGPGGTETPGIVIGDASTSSKVVSIKSLEILIEKGWNPDRPFITFTHPAPTKTERWRAIVVSASKTTKNLPAQSPNATFVVGPHEGDVQGVEYASLGMNFHLVDNNGAVTDQAVYDIIEGGTPVWGFNAVWENDEKDPRFSVLGGYDLDIEYPNGKIETTVSKSSNDRKHSSDLWTFTEPDWFTIWLVSWSSQQGNPRNSRIDGVTPKVRFMISPPGGPTGQENAQNVTGFHVANAYYAKNGQGQKALFVDLQWAKPDDRSYGGCVIHMIRGDGKDYVLTGLETGTGTTCELGSYPPEGVSEAVTFYAISVNTAGKENTYDEATTPKYSLSLLGPASSYPGVTAITASVTYAKDEFGNNTYGYLGSWSNPNASLWPDFQGVKVIKAKADRTERIDLTGIVTTGSFKTDMWPVTPETAIYLYFISVDVNGKEMPFDANTPRVGPLMITAQGGTIDNDALPDLDVANFAAGVEPVTFVNQAPNINGYLPTQAKQTTTVFNQNDQRLYRWMDAPTNMYKVVGSALDIDANTVTAGLIKAGAITSLHMAANEILVGPPPSAAQSDLRPPIFKVEKADRTMVGFFGTYQSWEGLYALNLRVGPSFASPTLEMTAQGMFIKGNTSNPVTFELTGNNSSFVRMSTATFDATYSSLGVMVKDSPLNNPLCEAWHVSRGMVLYEYRSSPAILTKQLGAFVRNPFYSAGELVLYYWQTGATEPVRGVYLTATENGAFKGVVAVEQNGRFQVGTDVGATATYTVDLYGGGVATLRFKGGILVP